MASVLISGIHPWFSYAYIFDEDDEDDEKEKNDAMRRHYYTNLLPQPDDAFVRELPPPLSARIALSELEERLKSNPRAHVGEVGLDKSFRLPLGPYDPSSALPRTKLSKYRVADGQQTRLLAAQVCLALRYGRSLSVHGVRAHGKLYDTICGCLNKGGPTLHVCLHSFSGPVDMVHQWLRTPADSLRVYFSFSNCINSRYDRWVDVIAAVPDDRLLVESDFHDAAHIDDEIASGMQTIARVKGWTTAHAAEQLALNTSRFLHEIS